MGRGGGLFTQVAMPEVVKSHVNKQKIKTVFF